MNFPLTLPGRRGESEEDDEMPTDAEIKVMWERYVVEAVDRCWKALIDLPIEQKVIALDRLTKLVAMEEATHHERQ